LQSSLLNFPHNIRAECLIQCVCDQLLILEIELGEFKGMLLQKFLRLFICFGGF
jgi:hypothetical protein